MWLKLGTTLMFLLAIALWWGRPLIMGKPPHRPATRIEVLEYSKRALVFSSLLLMVVTGAGVGSIVMVRRAKEEYRKLSTANMQALIEGAIQDRARKAAEQHDSPQ